VFSQSSPLDKPTLVSTRYGVSAVRNQKLCTMISPNLHRKEKITEETPRYILVKVQAQVEVPDELYSEYNSGYDNVGPPCYDILTEEEFANHHDPENDNEILCELSTEFALKHIKAVNNTYGKGINPEKIGEMVSDLRNFIDNNEELCGDDCEYLDSLIESVSE